MEAEEVSMFESSETMANFLGSTPLLADSWRLCSAANSSSSLEEGGGGLVVVVVEQVGQIGYVAFSSGNGALLYSQQQEMVPLTSAYGGPFSGLDWLQHQDDDADADADDDRQHEDEPIMIHKGFLHLFFTVFTSPVFQNQLKAIRERSKSIVLTGHSIAASTASLMALWLLCDLEANANASPPTHLLCITFGSPLMANKSLSRAILRQRWAGNFCHVVLKHDIVPRLFLAPNLASSPFNGHLHRSLQYWHLFISMSTSPQLGVQAAANHEMFMPEEEKSRFLNFVLACTERRAADTSAEQLGGLNALFSPFGSYLFCSEEEEGGGAICVDNSEAVVKLLHLLLSKASPRACFEDHLRYGDCVERVSRRLLIRSSRGLLLQESLIGKSGYEVGIEMALESMGLARQAPTTTDNAKLCLKKMGLTPNLNCAKLAISLAKVTPYRAQIEWYKASCDKSDHQLGYYDSFKRRQASRKDDHVNMLRLKLAKFWDNIIAKIDNNQLPHDFSKRAKWVNASHFYQLLVEPLDIAEYYRRDLHRSKGHYLEHGRERRHKVIDKWWRGRKVGEAEENHKRRNFAFAGLTEDSCFWAKVEEARELLGKVRIMERNSAEVWMAIESFERFARELIESRKVSQDVLARNSSYSLWVEELEELRSQVQHQVPRGRGGGGGLFGWENGSV